MNHLRTRHAVKLLATLSLAAATLAGCGVLTQYKAKGTQTTTVAHAADTPLAVISRNGSIEITGDSSRSDILIHATITCAGIDQNDADQRLAQTTITAAPDAQGLFTIAPSFPRGEQGGDGASLVITMPAAASGLTIKTSNGNVYVADMAGTLSITSSNGTVTVKQHDGDVTLVSSNGRVNASDITGSFKSTTSNGGCDLTSVAGELSVTTSNGAVTIALDEDQNGPVDARTSNGSIKVTVSRTFTGTFNCRTSNGRIALQGTGSTVDQSNVDKNTGTLRLGEGQAVHTLTTSNGNITVVTP